MKSLITILGFLVLLVSCKKQASSENEFSGVWVETTLELDTLDFNYSNLFDYSGNYDGIVSFRTNTYTDTVLNPDYPINLSTLYQYYFENNGAVIRLRDFLSSSTQFLPYSFSLSADKNHITVSKFYLRRQLPATVTFRKLRD
ncbi:MAG: hypothetical protein JNK27_00950 [Chitinophagaceae bacterium]|nr:hypothetical protein [Chitinophagaceae bacterium]